MVFTLAKRKTWIITPKAFRTLLLLLLCGASMAAFCGYSAWERPLIQGWIGSVVPYVQGIPLLPALFSHTKEIAVLGVCFAGLFLYIGLLFITGAIKPRELKAVLRRR